MAAPSDTLPDRRSRHRRLISLGLLVGMIAWPFVYHAPPATCPPGVAACPLRLMK